MNHHQDHNPNERMLLRFDELKKAVQQLAKALNEDESEFVRDAAIKRFEFCYELAWKTLKHVLSHVGLEARNPRDVFRLSLEQGFIVDGNLWSSIQRMRNQTTPTYDQELAEQVYDFVGASGLAAFQALIVALEKHFDQ